MCHSRVNGNLKTINIGFPFLWERHRTHKFIHSYKLRPREKISFPPFETIQSDASVQYIQKPEEDHYYLQQEQFPPSLL